MTTKAARPLSRKSKAITLVPLALLSGVWTASLVSTSATASSASDDHTLPDGTKVPSQAIKAPASVPVPGVVAPAVPQGSEDQVVRGASSNGIPAPALSAYQRAARIIDAADKSCNIPWELIAAIGRVESDHGRYGGNTLTKDGVSKPGIYGIPLNGKNGTQAVSDTDGGQLDKDRVYDRAVGPMQFIPSTWQVVKVDADGDGQRNPQDIDDAALATAVYLCSGKDNLGNRAGQEAAVYRYNHSQDYVNLVLRIMEAYSNGDYSAVPSGVNGGTTFSSSYSKAIDHQRQVAEHRQQVREQRRKAREQRRRHSSGSGSSTGTGTGTGTNTGTGTGSNPVTGSSSGGGVVGSVTDSGSTLTNKVTDGVKSGVKKVTGSGGSGSTSSSGGGAVNNTLTKAQATAKCLAQGVSALKLDQCVANLLK